MKSFPPLVSDTQYPYRRPAGTVWYRVWLKCNGTACISRIQVDSVMTNAAISVGVKPLVSRWVVNDGVKCGFGHGAFQPLEIMWGRDCMPGLDNDSRLSSLKLCSLDVVGTDLPEARDGRRAAARFFRECNLAIS